MRTIIIALLLTGCASADYYNSDDYRRKMRIREGERMFNETHRVIKKVTPRSGRPRRVRRKRYYS